MADAPTDDKRELHRPVSAAEAARGLLWSLLVLFLLGLGGISDNHFVQTYLIGPWGSIQFLLICTFAVLIWLVEQKYFKKRNRRIPATPEPK